MIIYKITNQINGKIYIGQTINTLEKRFNRHKQDALSGRLDTHFARALREYGVDNFVAEVIENEFGTIVTPTFPKLIFVLDENNIHPDSRFRYIYDMAIKSSARRMYPDYISAKVMRKHHNGQVFSPMGKCKLQLI